MVAAVTLRLLDPFGSGKIVLFEVTYDKDFHWVEMIAFSFLGIFGGLYGALFNKANIAWSRCLALCEGTKRNAPTLIETRCRFCSQARTERYFAQETPHPRSSAHSHPHGGNLVPEPVHKDGRDRARL